MGVLKTSAGKRSEAAPFLKKAIEARPDIIQYWVSYILILIELEKSEEAKIALQEATKNGLDPRRSKELDSRIIKITESKTKLEAPKSRLGSKIDYVIKLYNQGDLEKSLKKGSKT